MIVTKELNSISGVKEVLVGMGTDLNKELTGNLNLMTPEIEELTPNDFYIAVDTEKEEVFEEVVSKVDELLSKKAESQTSDYQPATFDSAVDALPDANMVVISVPGEYAADEAKKALNKGIHVMLFSDNVPIEKEIELKNWLMKRIIGYGA